MRKARVLLAEDHVIVAEGLRSILEEEIELVGTVGDGHALVEAAKRLKPEIIIADISMPLLNGLDAVRQLRREKVSAKVVFLTMHSEMPVAQEAFRAGASAYLLKQSAGKELLLAIREVVAGRRYITPLVTPDPINFFRETERALDDQSTTLTPRQREVLQLFAEGRTMKEVASVLKISVRTVESHKYDMMETLGAKSNAELVQYAIKVGLVQIPQSYEK